MKFLAFLAVVLLSGAISGTAQGMANFVLVEPVLDKAIYLENKALFDSGNEQDSVEFRIAHEEYRTWQKGGQLVSSAILGMSMGSLFGLVFGYARKSLPSSNILKKTLILAVIMWLILFIIPFVKYPSNPPTVGDPNTINERTTLYVGLIAVTFSGLLTALADADNFLFELNGIFKAYERSRSLPHLHGENYCPRFHICQSFENFLCDIEFF